MIYHSKAVILKNGQSVTFRSPTSDDASQMLTFLNRIASDSDYLIRYPEECETSPEKEANLIASVCRSEYDLYITAFAENKIVGNCQLAFQKRMKTKHRASISIGILKEYRGIGLGRAMMEELISIAREHQILQLELEYIEGNDRARNLYEKMGFFCTGERPDAIRLKDGTLLKEISMMKKL